MTDSSSSFISTRRIGAAEISLILEGSGPFPVELNVPEEVWRPETPEADVAGNAMLASGGALIRIGGALVVVDPGLDDPGTPTSAAAAQVFAGWSFTPGFQVALDRLGVANDAVTHVVITHAHFDHCLGVAIDRDGDPQPRFPNATYLLDRADWEYHFDPDGAPRPLAASPFAEVNREMRRRLLGISQAGLLDLVEGVCTVVPGLTTIPTPGETPGHRAVRLEAGGETCWLLGDIVHYAVEFRHPDWLTPTRRDAEAMVASRRAVFPRLVAERALVNWSHAPFPGWGRLAAADGGYAWQPLG